MDPNNKTARNGIWNGGLLPCDSSNGWNKNDTHKAMNTLLESRFWKNSYVSTEDVEKILNGDVSINACNKDGNTPLHLALENNVTTEVLMKLLDAGADVNVSDGLGRTPLHIAIYSNTTQEVIVKLLDAGADVNICDKYGNSPLHYALLDTDADIDVRDEDGDSSLHHVLDKKEVFALLIKAGANVNARDGAGTTILHYASQSHYEEIASMLIEAGADVNTRDWYAGGTPLHSAVNYQDISLEQDRMVEVLLKGGANTNARNKDGKTPLELFKEGKEENELKTSKAYQQLWNAEINKRDKIK